MRGTYKQVPLSRSAAKTAPSSGGWLASKQPATSSAGTRFQPPKLELADRIGVADHLRVVLKAGQTFMRDLGRDHEEHVFCIEAMFHVRCGMPLRMLSGCLTSLGVESQITRRAEAQELWSSRVSEFCVTAEYVAMRLAAYAWPSEFELRSQYRDLMLHCGRLCTCEYVQKHVLVQPQHEQAKTCRLQQKQFTAARQQALLQLTTGEKEHGSPIVGCWPPKASNSNSSLQASQQPATGRWPSSNGRRGGRSYIQDACPMESW